MSMRRGWGVGGRAQLGKQWMGRIGQEGVGLVELRREVYVGSGKVEGMGEEGREKKGWSVIKGWRQRRMREYDREGEGMVNNRMECDSMTKGS